VRLPIEMYTAEREREFDAAEADVADLLGAKPPGLLFRS
jgi:hypothetical protein